MFQEFFLATDVQALGTRPTDATGSEYANPTMEDTNCVVCHETVDPVAGTFANWTDLGAFRPPGHAERGENVDDLDLLDVPVNTWYSDMRPPGFLAKEMPADWNGAGLQWLATQTVKDPRFALSAIHLLYRGLTGQKPLVEPTDPHRKRLHRGRPRGEGPARGVPGDRRGVPRQRLRPAHSGHRHRQEPVLPGLQLLRGDERRAAARAQRPGHGAPADPGAAAPQDHRHHRRGLGARSRILTCWTRTSSSSFTAASTPTR